MTLLVLPAASSPNINNRISFDPKILFMSLEMFPPMSAAVCRHRLLSRVSWPAGCGAGLIDRDWVCMDDKVVMRRAVVLSKSCC